MPFAVGKTRERERERERESFVIDTDARDGRTNGERSRARAPSAERLRSYFLNPLCDVGVSGGRGGGGAKNGLIKKGAEGSDRGEEVHSVCLSALTCPCATSGKQSEIRPKRLRDHRILRLPDAAVHTCSRPSAAMREISIVSHPPKHTRPPAQVRLGRRKRD